MPNGEHLNRDQKIAIVAIIVTIIGIVGGIILAVFFKPWNIPPTTPLFNESGVVIDSDGNYEINWSSSERAISYILEEASDHSFTNPIRVYKGSEKKASISGKSDGDYYYRVRACNRAGESEWCSTKTVKVSKPVVKGTISVDSTPSGASIYLNNEYKGETPLTIIEVSPGTYIIILKLEGYEDWSTIVQVSAGETSYVNETLPTTTTPTPTPTPTSTPTST
ncbi:MAG: PEGA domain-containing protein, partial [Thermoplasmatales archaeon]|nr:PEGA domain-containing protein [Thermoplasmatales archaeon]